MTKILDSVQETALFTLRSRTIEAEKNEPVITDPMGKECLDRLSALMPLETRKKILEKKLPSSLTMYIALRARKYDNYAGSFLNSYPEGIVVNLGCGFDTRYWRIGAKHSQYIEIDLPEVIDIKKQILGKDVNYTMIGCSVTDPAWIKEITAIQKEKILFLAEGLFMYLNPVDVINVFKRMDATFSKSGIVFEAVNEKYTKGFWKKVAASKMKRRLESDAGYSYNFGLKSATDIESYGTKIKVLEEWNYIEEDDVKPAFLRLLRNFKMFTRSQWTIRASIG